MKIDINHTISLTDLIVIVVGAATLFFSAILPIGGLLRWMTGPLRLTYLEDGTAKAASRAVGKGTHIVTVILQPKITDQLGLIDIRFVEGHWFWRKNAPREKIEIVAVQKTSWGDVQHPALKSFEPNEVGGLRIAFAEPKTWMAGVFLYVAIVVEARAPWSGLLSVECYMNGRPKIRRRFAVVPEAVS